MQRAFSPGSKLTRPTKAIFALTPSAKTRIRQLMKERKEETQRDAIGIRVGTKSGGCNGLMYNMDFIEEVPQGDELVKDEDITIFVEPKALLAVVGTEMDFVESPVRSEFVFRNPNAKSQCGCNESFSVIE